MPTYADIASGGKGERNRLIIHDSEETKDQNVDKRQVVSETLREIPIDRCQTTKAGSVILDFKDKQTLDSAQRKLDQDKEQHKLESRQIKKLWPKIVLTHIQEDSDEMLEAIINKNACLRNFQNIKDEISIVAVKERDSHKHIIMKCSPAVRRAIYENGDTIYTQYSRKHVKDSYRVVFCFYCSGFNHLESQCRVKQNQGRPVCGLCSLAHNTRDCNVNELKCHHCVKQNRENTNHAVFDRTCPSYITQARQIQQNTDHGYTH